MNVHAKVTADRSAAPGGEQQHIPVTGRQRGQRLGQQRAHRLGRDIGSHPFGVTRNLRLGRGGPPDPVLAGLVPAMLADQVGGDPVQPGPGIRVAEVIPVPLGESARNVSATRSSATWRPARRAR